MSLKAQFHEVIVDYCWRSRSIRGARPEKLLQEIYDDNDGAVGVAVRYTGRGSEPGPGFAELFNAGRPELTLEGAMLRPEFKRLFTEAQRSKARERVGDDIADAIEKGEFP